MNALEARKALRLFANAHKACATLDELLDACEKYETEIESYTNAISRLKEAHEGILKSIESERATYISVSNELKANLARVKEECASKITELTNNVKLHEESAMTAIKNKNIEVAEHHELITNKKRELTGELQELQKEYDELVLRLKALKNVITSVDV